MTTEPTINLTGGPPPGTGPASDEDRALAHAADLMTTGRLDDAEQALSGWADAGSPRASYALGMLLIRRDQLVDAIRVLGQAADAHPEHVRCQLGLAQAQERAGVRDAALHSYQRVLSLDPRNATATAAVRRLTTPPAPAAGAAGSPLSTTASPTESTGKTHATVSDLLEKPPATTDAPAGTGASAGDSFDDALRGAFLASYRRRFGSHLGAWTGSLLVAAAVLLLLTTPDADTTSPAGTDPLLAQASWRLAVLLAVVGAALLLHALTSTMTTRYEFRERAVDVRTGVLFRRRRTVWLWDTAEIALHQPLWHSLTGTAELLLFSGSATLNVGRKPRTRVTGFASAAHVEATRVRLQTRALYERRAMKKQWI